MFVKICLSLFASHPGQPGIPTANNWLRIAIWACVGHSLSKRWEYVLISTVDTKIKVTGWSLTGLLQAWANPCAAEMQRLWSKCSACAAEIKCLWSRNAGPVQQKCRACVAEYSACAAEYSACAAECDACAAEMQCLCSRNAVPVQQIRCLCNRNAANTVPVQQNYSACAANTVPAQQKYGACACPRSRIQCLCSKYGACTAEI